MERNDKKKISHKSKRKSIDKTFIKRKSQIIKSRPKIDNIARRPTVLLNGELSLVQNPSHNLRKRRTVQLNAQSSYYHMQPQLIMFQQPNSNKSIIPNQLGDPALSVNQKIDPKIEFGARPEKIKCPYCQRIMMTNIEDRCNCCSFFPYFLMFIVPFIIIFYIFCINVEYCACEFGCKVADNSCCFYPTCCSCVIRPNLDDCRCCLDVDHYCSHCGKLIGNRNACTDICPPCCRCG